MDQKTYDRIVVAEAKGDLAPNERAVLLEADPVRWLESLSRQRFFAQAHIRTRRDKIRKAAAALAIGERQGPTPPEYLRVKREIDALNAATARFIAGLEERLPEVRVLVDALPEQREVAAKAVEALARARRIIDEDRPVDEILDHLESFLDGALAQVGAPQNA